MRNLNIMRFSAYKLLYFFILFTGLLGAGVSCNHEFSDSGDLSNKTLGIDELFEKISNTQVRHGRVLYVEFTWNKIDNTAVIDFIEEREPDFFVLETPKTSARGTGYKVECSNGSKSWTKTCDSNISCGKLIKECLDQGGCATICQKTMVYLGDDYNTFYVY